MNDNLFIEKLTWFKNNERPEAVLVIADNPELIKIVVAWTSLDVQRTDKLTKLTETTECETWKWLWRNARFSLKELKNKVGIPFSEAALESKINLLNGNRVIYPDGTLNSFVTRYLREKVLKLFEAKTKRTVKKGENTVS